MLDKPFAQITANDVKVASVRGSRASTGDRSGKMTAEHESPVQITCRSLKASICCWFYPQMHL
jgi:hypothetical protein